MKSSTLYYLYSNRLLFGLIGSVNDLDTITCPSVSSLGAIAMEFGMDIIVTYGTSSIIYILVTTDVVGDNWCGRSGLWPFRSVAVPVCGRFGLWPFRFVAVPVCGRFGLWPFRFVAAMTSYQHQYRGVSQFEDASLTVFIGILIITIHYGNIFSCKGIFKTETGPWLPFHCKDRYRNSHHKDKAAPWPSTRILNLWGWSFYWDWAIALPVESLCFLSSD